VAGSVGDEARTARVEEDTKLSTDARIALAFRLGQRDLVTYATANGLTLKQAYRALRRAASAGRTPSKVMDDLNR
jgi:hypothetical protein